ncbi:unnamed protein product, partial [Scytosiphon promiscuus]
MVFLSGPVLILALGVIFVLFIKSGVLGLFCLVQGKLISWGECHGFCKETQTGLSRLRSDKFYCDPLTRLSMKCNVIQSCWIWSVFSLLRWGGGTWIPPPLKRDHGPFGQYCSARIPFLVRKSEEH